MNPIFPNNTVELLSQQWAERSQRSSKIPSDVSLHEHGNEKKEPSAPPIPKKFSDEDIDELLKLNKIAVTPAHRINARFLLRHHFTLRKEIFDILDNLLPNSTLSGIRGEAFVAAASKLKYEDIARGYAIFLSTIEANHGSIVSEISDLQGVFKDLISESFNLTNPVVDSGILREAFSETIEFWDSFLKDTNTQLRWMIDRKVITSKMLSYIKDSQNLIKVLETVDAKQTIKLVQYLRTSVEKSTLIVKILFSDAILSRDDKHLHLLDQGSCYSIGTLMKGHIQPARMWIHDKKSNSSEVLDPENLTLFFRWHAKDLGVVEAELVTRNDTLDLTFASLDSGVAKLLDENNLRLSERLRSIGFEPELSPCIHEVKVDDEKTEIENISVEKMQHLDIKA